MHDNWLACGSCLSLIHSGQDQALANAYHHNGNANTTDAQAYSHADLSHRVRIIRAIKELHDGFRRARLPGPPRLHTYV